MFINALYIDSVEDSNVRRTMEKDVATLALTFKSEPSKYYDLYAPSLDYMDQNAQLTTEIGSNISSYETLATYYSANHAMLATVTISAAALLSSSLF